MQLHEFIELYGQKHDPVKTAMLGAAYRSEFVKKSYEYQEFLNSMKLHCPEIVETFDLLDRRIIKRTNTVYGRIHNFKHDLVRALTRLFNIDTKE